MPIFELITEDRLSRPVAVIIPVELPLSDFYFVNSLLPDAVVNQPKLAKRWQVHQVLSEPYWASKQLKRVPMTRPRGHALQIL